MEDTVLYYPVMFSILLVAICWMLSLYFMEKKTSADCTLYNSYVTDWYKEKKEDFGVMDSLNDICRELVEKIYNIEIPKKYHIKYGCDLINLCPKNTLLYNGNIPKKEKYVLFDLHSEMGLNFYIFYSKDNIIKYEPSDNDTETLNIIYSIAKKNLTKSLKTYIKNSTDDRLKEFPTDKIKGYIGIIGNKMYIEVEEDNPGDDSNYMGIQYNFLKPVHKKILEYNNVIEKKSSKIACINMVCRDEDFNAAISLLKN